MTETQMQALKKKKLNGQTSGESEYPGYQGSQGRFQAGGLAERIYQQGYVGSYAKELKDVL